MELPKVAEFSEKKTERPKKISTHATVGVRITISWWMAKT